jgi:hypothetical protein
VCFSSRDVEPWIQPLRDSGFQKKRCTTSTTQNPEPKLVRFRTDLLNNLRYAGLMDENDDDVRKHLADLATAITPEEHVVMY